ncbi:MAG: nucleotide exchange factor GrpE [Candidatus Syntrophopropionicum ammoniitolerans]
MNRHETAERIEQIALLEKELAAEKNRHMRTLADFDNYRKRVEREAASRAAQGKKELLGDLLAVLDNLERALPQIGDEVPLGCGANPPATHRCAHAARAGKTRQPGPGI